jgi:hypothetical protein
MEAGMDEMEFTEAESNFSDLIYEYEPLYGIHDWGAEGEESEEEQTSFNGSEDAEME